MIKHFYSHIIETDSISIELESFSLDADEKDHLERLADSQIHHAVIDTVLSELLEEDKKQFLKHIHSKSYDKVWKLLHSKIDDVEDKIKKTVGLVKKELLKDIKNLSENKE